MIIGVGTDLTEIVRMEAILRKPSGARFLAKILTEEERKDFGRRFGPVAGAWSKRAAEFAAGRFAVKEAVAKAFGCGIGSLLGFHDIHISADAAGRPVCRVRAEALARIGLAERETAVHISITHTEATAGAFAVVERI